MGIWTPEAQWVGPSPNQSGAMVEQRGMVLHVMQGSLAGSIAWGKNPDSDVSFHFGTRKDGLVQQLVDTSITAWTQCQGNGHWVSVENEDYNTNPLSAAQVESVARLYARGVREYGWPLQTTDSPSGRGLGWHGMGGTAWCNHPTCPGEPIKEQRPAILARAAQILGGASPGAEDKMIAHMWKDTAGQYWYVTGPLAMRQKVNAWQVDTIRYYATKHTPGFTLVDLTATAITPDIVAQLGVDITNVGQSGGGGTVSGPVDLTPAALDAIEARVDKQLDELAD